MKAHWDEDISILSAENVNFLVETAGLGSRLAAVMIDLILQGLTAVAVSWLLGAAMSYVPPGAAGQMFASATMALIYLSFFLIFYAYFFFLEWLWAWQTPGKRMVGLRVIHANGLPITWWPAFMRNLLRIIDFLPFGYGLGGLVAVWGPHNQRVGDIVAGTIVARERRDANQKPILGISEAVDAFLASRQTPLPQAATAQTHIADAEPDNAAVDPHTATLRLRLSQEDYEFVREFLMRRETMPTAVRTRLAQRLARQIAAKLGEAPPPEAQAESMLEHIARTFKG